MVESSVKAESSELAVGGHLRLTRTHVEIITAQLQRIDAESVSRGDL